MYCLKGVELLNFNPRETKTQLKILFTKNDVLKNMIIDVVLSHPIDIVNKILLLVKSEDKVIIDESDDVLQNLFITRVSDEEAVEEKLLSFFTINCMFVLTY